MPKQNSKNSYFSTPSWILLRENLGILGNLEIRRRNCLGESEELESEAGVQSLRNWTITPKIISEELKINKKVGIFLKHFSVFPKTFYGQENRKIVKIAPKFKFLKIIT